MAVPQVNLVADNLTVHLIALRSESYCRITEFMDYVYSPETPTELRVAVLNLMLARLFKSIPNDVRRRNSLFVFPFRRY